MILQALIVTNVREVGHSIWIGPLPMIQPSDVWIRRVVIHAFATMMLGIVVVTSSVLRDREPLVPCKLHRSLSTRSGEHS